MPLMVLIRDGSGKEDLIMSSGHHVMARNQANYYNCYANARPAMIFNDVSEI